MICEISAVSPYGLTGATSVTVDAWLKTAPQFTSTPVITADKNTLKLDYSLSGNSLTTAISSGTGQHVPTIPTVWPFVTDAA